MSGRVEIHKAEQRFVVEVRGEEYEKAREMMEEVMRIVRGVEKIYPGVRMREMVRENPAAGFRRLKPLAEPSRLTRREKEVAGLEKAKVTPMIKSEPPFLFPLFPLLLFFVRFHF